MQHPIWKWTWPMFSQGSLGAFHNATFIPGIAYRDSRPPSEVLMSNPQCHIHVRKRHGRCLGQSSGGALDVAVVVSWNLKIAMTGIKYLCIVFNRGEGGRVHQLAKMRLCTMTWPQGSSAHFFLDDLEKNEVENGIKSSAFSAKQESRGE